MAGLIETVLDQQIQVVALIQDLAANVRIKLLETPHLSILLGDQLLVESGDLDKHVVIGKVEIRREPLCGIAISIPCEDEGPWLVFPANVVEIQQTRKLPFAVVREAVWPDTGARRFGLDWDVYPPTAFWTARSGF